jgi:hypothetical protein
VNFQRVAAGVAPGPNERQVGENLAAHQQPNAKRRVMVIETVHRQETPQQLNSLSQRASRQHIPISNNMNSVSAREFHPGRHKLAQMPVPDRLESKPQCG